MTNRQNTEEVKKKDRDILYEINRLRFVTMEQFRMISGYGQSDKFEKYREYEKVGDVTSKVIKSSDFYTAKNRDRQGKYLSLTERGMKYIYDYGYEVTSTSRVNRGVNAERISAILKTNDL